MNNHIPPDQGPDDFSDVDGDGVNWSSGPDIIDEDPHPDGPPPPPIYY